MLRPGAITVPPLANPALAGASIVLRWPQSFSTTGNNWASKFGIQAIDAVGGNALNGGTQAVALDADKQEVIRFTGAAAGFVRQFNATRYSWFTERPPKSLRSPFNCWSHRAILRWPVLPVVGNGDNGLNIAVGTLDGYNQHPDGSVKHGISLTAPGGNTLRLRASRAGGAFSIDEPLNGIDLQNWHEYELRIVTGDAGADPYLVACIDDVEVSQRYSWTAAAALLPTAQSGAAFDGYQFGVMCSNAQYFDLKTWEIIAASSVAALR